MGGEAIHSTVQNTLSVLQKQAAALPLQLLPGANDEAAAEAVSQEFESVFLSQMLQHMWSGVAVDPVFGGGHAEEVYRSMLIDEYASLMAQTGGIGLAGEIKAELLTLQEVNL